MDAELRGLTEKGWSCPPFERQPGLRVNLMPHAGGYVALLILKTQAPPPGPVLNFREYLPLTASAAPDSSPRPLRTTEPQEGNPLPRGTLPAVPP